MFAIPQRSFSAFLPPPTLDLPLPNCLSMFFSWKVLPWIGSAVARDFQNQQNASQDSKNVVLSAQESKPCIGLLENHTIGLKCGFCPWERHSSQEFLAKVLDGLDRSDVQFDCRTLASRLRLCGDANALFAGRRVHHYIIQCGLIQNVFLGNLLLQMYCSCNALEDVCAWFHKMDQHDSFSWNFMTTAYARHGQCNWALQLYDQMHLEGTMADEFIVTSILSACASQVALTEGKRMHARIFGSKLEAVPVVENALVNLYGRCAKLLEARKTFDKMSKRSVVAYTMMITAYSQQGYCKEALWLFNQMLQEAVAPNKATILSILDACASQAALTKGKQVHGCIMDSEFQSNVMISTALVNMYGKCGHLEDARRIFDKMPDQNVVSWTAMIAGYARHGCRKEALQLFEQMQWKGVMPNKVTFISILDACASKEAVGIGKQIHAHITHYGFDSDVVVATAVVNMYGKCSSLGDAWRMFEKMPERNVVSWNAMIAAYAQFGCAKETLKIFDQMQQSGVNPGKVTYVSILSACASEAAFVEGKDMHAQVMRCGYHTDVIVGNAILNMYSKCGNLELARVTFETMLERNVVSWTTMIAAYAQHGNGKEALQLLDRMKREGILPNEITFVSILSACSHAGLVDEGRQCLALMSKVHGVTATREHYDCVLDLLGRAGLLHEAQELLGKMPVQPSLVSWLTYLGACRNQVDIERGEHAADHVFEMYPECPVPYVILSNIYAVAGRDSDAEKVLTRMISKGLMKHQGSSYMEINGRIHEFLAKDQCHPQIEEIYSELWRLNRQIEEAGYASISKFLLNDPEEDGGDPKGCSHTEIMAIALGFLSTPSQTMLFIAKNVRMCSDCHSFTQLVSKIFHRQIIVRDCHGFHHMNEGVCSCADYLVCK